MSVARAIRAASPLQRRVKPGKQGIEARDRHRFREKAPHRVVDSLDLDAAFEKQIPVENRWDYLIGTTLPTRRLVAVEVHSAYSSQVRGVIAKKRAAQAQLRGHLNEQARIDDWVWIASGPTRITKTMPQWRLLTSEGIRLVGSKLVLD